MKTVKEFIRVFLFYRNELFLFAEFLNANDLLPRSHPAQINSFPERVDIQANGLPGIHIVNLVKRNSPSGNITNFDLQFFQAASGVLNIQYVSHRIREEFDCRCNLIRIQICRQRF